MTREKLGLGAAWAMAVGGMIGGGIFATLGVVISLAGAWAWASFLIGGLIAMATGQSYVRLSLAFDREGGAYAFLRETGHTRLAAPVGWVLIAGYTLTVAVYAYTFGAYLGHAIGGPAWLAPAAAVAAIAALTGVNLLGVGEAAEVEIVAVWGKLIVLVALAAFGVAMWAPERLTPDGPPPGWVGVLVGAASVFMAYEGFQLLAYDYDDMDNPKHTLKRAMPLAITVAAAVYIAVAIGTAMLVGAGSVVRDGEVALADAGRAALGTAGFLAVTAAAAFSTASAINATLFATARLSRDVAAEGGLPGWFGREDENGVPWIAVVAIALAAAALALLGGLQELVQGASLVFLGVFALVNWLAFRKAPQGRWLAFLGMIGALVATILLAVHLAGFV